MAPGRPQSTHSKHRVDLVLSKENKSECSRDFFLRADNLRTFTTARFYFWTQQWFSFALVPTESRQGVRAIEWLVGQERERNWITISFLPLTNATNVDTLFCSLFKHTHLQKEDNFTGLQWESRERTYGKCLETCHQRCKCWQTDQCFTGSYQMVGKCESFRVATNRQKVCVPVKLSDIRGT